MFHNVGSKIKNIPVYKYQNFPQMKRGKEKKRPQCRKYITKAFTLNFYRLRKVTLFVQFNVEK